MAPVTPNLPLLVPEPIDPLVPAALPSRLIARARPRAPGRRSRLRHPRQDRSPRCASQVPCPCVRSSCSYARASSCCPSVLRCRAARRAGRKASRPTRGRAPSKRRPLKKGRRFHHSFVLGLRLRLRRAGASRQRRRREVPITRASAVEHAMVILLPSAVSTESTSVLASARLVDRLGPTCHHAPSFPPSASAQPLSSSPMGQSWNASQK